jgi:hypothetical protein
MPVPTRGRSRRPDPCETRSSTKSEKRGAVTVHPVHRWREPWFRMVSMRERHPAARRPGDAAGRADLIAAKGRLRRMSRPRAGTCREPSGLPQANAKAWTWA